MKDVRSRCLILTTLALVTFPLAATVALAAPIIELDTRRVLPLTDRVEGAALGDFDEDGKTDIASVHSYLSNGVEIFRGLGSGRYTPAGSITTSGRPFEITAADLNHDGHIDLAMTGIGPSLTVLLGNGSGGFSAPVGYGATTRSDDLATADFNGDSHLDVAVSHVFTNTISVFLGTGTGSFGQPQSIPNPAGSSYGVVTADFKIDGHIDIAVGVPSGVVVLPGDGAGGFGPPLQSLNGLGSSGLTGADVDDDGLLDLVATNPGAGSLLVLGSVGDGTFSLMRDVPVSAGIDALAIGDLNADGRTDVVAGGTGDQVHVLLATGPGEFGSPVAYRAGSLPDTLLVADLDEDGRQDVLAGNTLGYELVVLPGNGLGRLAAEISIPLQWSQTPDLAAADFNEDGLVDLAALNSDGPYIFECGGGGLAPAPEGPLDCDPRMLLTFLPRTGPATFGAPLNAPTRCAPGAMAIADFNLDGHLDVATANRGARDAFGICFPASLSILRGDGRGAFGPLADLEVADEPDDVAAGDFNEDGIPDLVAAFGDAGIVRVYRVDPGGLIVPVSGLLLASGPRALAVGDLNTDGHLDVAAALPGNGHVAILRGDGAGQLTPIAECAPGTGGGAPRSLSIGDFDGDDDIDIAAAVQSSLSVMHRSGNSFCVGASETIPIPAGASRVGAGDLDNDGILDLLAADSSRRLTVVRGTRPLLSAEADPYGAYYAQTVATADFDDDGLLDVAVTSSVGNSISLVRNVTAAAPRLVLNLDGSMVEWLGVAGALGYDLVRGGLGALRATGGDFTSAPEACVADDLATTFIIAPGDPAPGDGWWFLARPVFESGPGTYDSGSPAQVGSRDAEIAASSLACP